MLHLRCGSVLDENLVGSGWIGGSPFEMQHGISHIAFTHIGDTKEHT